MSRLGSANLSHMISDVWSFIWYVSASIPVSMVYNEGNHWQDLCCVVVILCERAKCVTYWETWSQREREDILPIPKEKINRTVLCVVFILLVFKKFYPKVKKYLKYIIHISYNILYTSVAVHITMWKWGPYSTSILPTYYKSVLYIIIKNVLLSNVKKSNKRRP